jgi:transcriptional regulator with XRE-family HTH domain
MATVTPIIRKQEASRLRDAYQRMKLLKGTTQAEIAARCGWSGASTFNRILTGKSPLSLESLIKLAPALGVHPSVISPRLIRAENADTQSRAPRLLPVSVVKSIIRGGWEEPIESPLRLSHYTADETAYALIFELGVAPVGLAGWVMVVEPGRKVCQGDSAVVTNGVGKYSFGCVGELRLDGMFPVEIQGKGVILSKRRHCMLVSSLCRAGDLTDFGAGTKCE